MTDFPYTPPILAKLEKTLSPERLSTYRKLTQDGPEKAIKLYVWNTALSAALYTSIQGFEITLRNGLHNCLSEAFCDDWYDTLKLENREREQVDNVKKYLKEVGKPGSPPNIVAAIGFGFWAGLLDRLYENDLWRPYLRKAFPYGPDPLRRKHVFAVVDRVRRLRNRIAHHEPILQRKLDDDHKEILELISWICPDTEKWVSHHSRFIEIWTNKPI